MLGGESAIRNDFGGTGVSPVQAQAKACGNRKYSFDRNSVYVIANFDNEALV